MMAEYSAFSLLANALKGNKDWKPAWSQPPIVPPEVMPIAVLPENQEPPLSPGWVQTLVCTVS